MVVEFTNTRTISTYHHLSCKFESRSRRGVLDKTLGDKVCQALMLGRWVSPSCNNVAPVTNLCLGRATTRSHSSQWSKTKVPVET